MNLLRERTRIALPTLSCLRERAGVRARHARGAQMNRPCERNRLAFSSLSPVPGGEGWGEGVE